MSWDANGSPVEAGFGSPEDIATMRPDNRFVTKRGFFIDQRREAEAIEAAYVAAEAKPFPGQVWEVEGVRYVHRGDDFKVTGRLIFDPRIGRERA